MNNHTSSNEKPSENEEIVCTPEHPFYILNTSYDTPLVNFEDRDNGEHSGQWVCAKDLKTSMQVLLASGSYGKIESLEIEELDTLETTYNFEVEILLSLLTGSKLDRINAKERNTFNVEGKGLVESKDVEIGDKIILENGEIATVLSTESKTTGGPECTYNLEVADFHTYYVGESGILIHNCCDTPIDDVIKTGNVKDYIIADGYADAFTIAKQKGGVAGNPVSSTPNNYGGNDLTFIRATKSGGKIDVKILEHMTGHPARGMSTHLNVNYGIDGKNWHIFFRR